MITPFKFLIQDHEEEKIQEKRKLNGVKVEQKPDEIFRVMVPEGQASVSRASGYFLRSSSERRSAGLYVRKRKGEGWGRQRRKNIKKSGSKSRTIAIVRFNRFLPCTVKNA